MDEPGGVGQEEGGGAYRTFIPVHNEGSGGAGGSAGSIVDQDVLHVNLPHIKTGREPAPRGGSFSFRSSTGAAR